MRPAAYTSQANARRRLPAQPPGSRARAENIGQPLRVLIVSDVAFLREGLSEILARHSDLCVVASVGDQDQALGRIFAGDVDAVLLDTSLLDGLATVASMVATAPTVPIIALAINEAEHTVLTWAEAGITGYVLRSASIADLINTVMLAVRGEQACSPKVGGAMLRRLRQLALNTRQKRLLGAEVRLTVREQEIAKLISEGLSNKLIAHRLNIGLATAKCHVHHIFEKLKLSKRGDVANWLRQ